MKTPAFLLGLLFIQTIAFGQKNDLPNRDPFTLKLAVDETNSYQEDIKSSAYISNDNVIKLHPGEKIYVEIELVKEEITSMKTVKENLKPTKTVTIAFSQLTKEKKHEAMTLEIQNPFDKKLEYQISMLIMEHNMWVSVDVSPVEPKGSAYEIWPGMFVTIALSNWELK